MKCYWQCNIHWTAGTELNRLRSSYGDRDIKSERRLSKYVCIVGCVQIDIKNIPATYEPLKVLETVELAVLNRYCAKVAVLLADSNVRIS